jgi:hypothetical protein
VNAVISLIVNFPALKNPEWSDDSGTLPLEDSGIFMIPCQGYSLNVVEPVLDKGQWWDYVW